MVGKSYDGNLALATAVTGVPGLSTIVDISGPSDYYKYTRENGVVTRGSHYVSQLTETETETVTDPDRHAHCQAVRDEIGAADGDATGDYSAFWDERNYVKDAGKVRASVFMVHGRNDDNLRPDHFRDFWSAISARGVSPKLWLSEEGHVDPFGFRRAAWVDTLHRWFDRWLWQVPNRITAEPGVDLERGPDVRAQPELADRTPAARAGRPYDFTLPLLPADHVFPAGHRRAWSWSAATGTTPASPTRPGHTSPSTPRPAPST